MFDVLMSVYFEGHLESGGTVDVCGAVKKEMNFGVCFDAEEFYFSFVKSLHPLLKAKQSPAALVNIVTGSLSVVLLFSPFLHVLGDPGWHS